MKPVRILVDSLADANLPNAQITNAREIIRRLDPDRFHVGVFCAGEPDPQVGRRPNTKIIPLPRRRRTLTILREFVFGSHEILFYMKAAPAGLMYARMRRFWKRGKVTVGTIESQSNLDREPTIRKATINLWEQTILRCNYLFSNSGAVKQNLEREYGLPSEIVPTGVDTKVFAPCPSRKANSRPQVLFVGSLRPFKQPQLLLDSAVRYPYADFVLAGEGLLLEELRGCAARDGLANVYLLGGQTANELRDLYQRADIFLFPSEWEGSPKVILEAAASGLPVIARNNYRPETVIDGVTGYLVGTDSELYLRLEQLLLDPDLRRRLGVAGRKHSEHFDWDVIACQWEDIFLHIRPSKVRPNKNSG